MINMPRSQQIPSSHINNDATHHRVTCSSSSFISGLSLSLTTFVEKSSIEAKARGWEIERMFDVITHILSLLSLHFTFTASPQSFSVVSAILAFAPHKASSPFQSSYSLTEENKINRYISNTAANPFSVRFLFALTSRSQWVGSSTANIIILQSFPFHIQPPPILSLCRSVGVMKTHFPLCGRQPTNSTSTYSSSDESLH